MGFGTLFFGYCLLLNLFNYRFTDAVAAVIMLYALYKLSGVNPGFKAASIGAAVFTALGLCELVLWVLTTMFSVGIPDLVETLFILLRHLTVCITTVLMLSGMKDVSAFVGLNALAKKCYRLICGTVAIYAFYMLMELNVLGTLLPSGVLAAAVLVALVSMIALIIVNLTAIYGCYSGICMPEDDMDGEKKSRFEFVNKFREHQQERQREYAEYRLDKMKKKAEKAKQKDIIDDKQNKK